MAPDAIPFYEDGDELTCVPTIAVGASTFVKISGDLNADGLVQIAPAGAGDKVFGVALWDAAVGVRVTVHTIASHHTLPVQAGAAALSPGDSVKSGAAGVAVVGASGDPCYGVVLASCAANGLAKVSLRDHTLA